jgi:hypothetical protein
MDRRFGRAVCFIRHRQHFAALRFAMDTAVIKNAIGTLDKLLGKAKDTLFDIERHVFGVSAYGEGPSYEDPRGALKGFLEELHDVLLVVLEAANMPETRSTLVEAWRDFSKGDALENTNDYHEYDSSESPALTFLERLIDGLRISVSNEIPSEDASTLNRLEAMLDDTAALVHRRNPHPANEADIQRIMHDYLSACFHDFVKNPQIGGTLKNFIPDCGIKSVGAAIEFKFVRDKDEVAKAFSGIAEDSAGYKGSKDWTRFYAVIYQAEPFALKSEFRSDLKRIGATTWKVYLVNGPAKQAPRTKSKAKAKRSTSAA